MKLAMAHLVEAKADESVFAEVCCSAKREQVTRFGLLRTFT